MNKVDLLVESAMALCGDREVIDVRVGLSYTGVMLDDGATGVAMTFHRDLQGGCLPLQKAFSGQRVATLIEKADSANLIERTVAFATINAVLNRDQEGLVRGDTLELLNPGSSDRVGMVGYFAPLVAKLRRQVDDLVVFDNNRSGEEGVLPQDQLESQLPACSMVIITSTTLINQSFAGVMKSVRDCDKVALVGGSTPLDPRFAKFWGIQLLSGVIIRRSEEILRIISESGGMKSFKHCVEKVNLIC